MYQHIQTPQTTLNTATNGTNIRVTYKDIKEKIMLIN